MGMTSAKVDSVLFICILADKSLSVTDVKGFDYRASIPFNSSKTMEENMGEGKALTGLPVLKFRGGGYYRLNVHVPQRINKI